MLNQMIYQVSKGLSIFLTLVFLQTDAMGDTSTNVGVETRKCTALLITIAFKEKVLALVNIGGNYILLPTGMDHCMPD